MKPMGLGILFLLISWGLSAAVPISCEPFQYFGAAFDDKSTRSLKAAFGNVDEWLKGIQAKLGIPSISFGIVYDKELVHYSSIGLSDVETKSKPTPETIYCIGSITKVWTVLLAFRLRDIGIISFDENISDLDPNFSINNPWGITEDEARGKTLTIRHLASQISGLPREAPCEMENCDKGTSEIFELLSNHTLLHPTDVQPSYSNLAYAILGNVLSEYASGSGRSYEETMFNYVINPMNLTNTGLYLNEYQKNFAASGYDQDWQKVDYFDLKWAGPAGQLFSSVKDLSELMMQFFAAYPSLYQRKLNEEYDLVVSPQLLREMLRPFFINPDHKTGFGSPWEIYLKGGHIVRSKGGNVPGFSSEIAMIPELKLGIIALSNADGRGLISIPSSALDMLLPAFESWIEERKSKAMNHHSHTGYESIVGVYGFQGIPVVRVYQNENSLLPFLSAPTLLIYGQLVPESSDEDSKTFIFKDVDMNAEDCLTVTLEGVDGLPLRFTEYKEEKFHEIMIEGAFNEAEWMTA